MPSHPEPSLEAGLNALKQGNYQSAIAQLETIATREGVKPAGLQAQIGLVVAYARIGEVSKAIALCQTLAQNHNSQVKNWANRTLDILTIYTKNGLPAAKTDVTGLISSENSRETVAQSQEISASTSSGKIVHVSTATAKPLKIQNSAPNTSWRQAPRAKTWQNLPQVNILPLWLLAAGTFIALFWVMRELLKLATGLINNILVKLPKLEPLQLLYGDFTLFLLLMLFALIGLSPWLLDWLLTNFYGQRELAKKSLNTHSPEAFRVIQRYCQQRQWSFPKLNVLPITAPIALTYGNLPQTARIVVSQGLLDKLEDDEIATIYASQLGHIAHWDFIVMSLILLVTIPVYRVYQQLSKWGEETPQGIWQLPGTIIASLAYGVWSLLTGTALWLSHLRLYYSDRVATEITGNPNGLIRALLKIAIGIAVDIEKQECTSWQLESFNIVAPVGYQQSLCLGSIARHISWESFLMWDNINPYRRWFTINNSHPLIGDRLQRLCAIARNWHLETELKLESQQPLKVKHQPFFLQIAPFLGIPLGILFAGFIWLIWQIAFALNFLNLKWIYDDFSFVLGCILIAFSIGTLIRINSFFPDIKPATVQFDEHLPNLLANPAALPIDSITIRLVGKLLGRSGIGNCLAQDFILQSNIGLVKLHHISWFGQSINPQDLIGRQIIVTGWFRRGATPWIDVQMMQTQSGKTIHSPHPIWSTILAVAIEAWGAYILLTG